MRHKSKRQCAAAVSPDAKTDRLVERDSSLASVAPPNERDRPATKVAQRVCDRFQNVFQMPRARERPIDSRQWDRSNHSRRRMMMDTVTAAQRGRWDTNRPSYSPILDVCVIDSPHDP